MATPHSANPAEGLLIAALDHAAEDREAFLATACGGDAALLAEVRGMLAAHDAMPAGFLDGPAADPLATIKDGPGLRTAMRGLPVSEQPEEVIGLYKLREQIGEGGFGTVWVADQEKPVRRRVALKIIKLGMDTKEVITRFEQERQALALMDHPNIARVLDAGTTQTGRPYFVMELVRGVKITDYCDEKGLSTIERTQLFIQVCNAVQHAHQKGIIHRDLKPSNILVTINDGVAVPKVIDFGVAKATQGRLTDGTIYTQFQQMIGTPLYMSPEQAEMTSVDVDTRSDIYALGVLLYELLTGRTPIDMNTMAQAGMDEIRRLIRDVDPPRPSARLKTLDGHELTSMAKRRHTEAARLPASLQGDLDWIVMKCLEKDRARRYDTANGLALDLQRHLKNEVVVARPPTTAYLLNKLFRRNKLAFAAGTAIAASLVIGIAASLRQAVRAKSAEHQAVAAFDELRATAPAFAEQARALAAKEQYGDAVEKIDYAIKLRPDAAEFLVAKADLLQCQFQLTEAARIYRAALALQPSHARAEASSRLCDELLAAPVGSDGKLTRESLGKLHLAMQMQQRPAAELLPVARLLGAEKDLLVAYWLDRLKDLPISAEKPLKERLTVREDGLLELDLTSTQITELAPLAGMPLGKLSLWNCRRIADFTPLGEFRSLTYLDLDGTQIADLSVLRGLSLELLSIGGTAVSDLSPLRGMKLKTLGLYRCRNVSDLSPLEGMPLTELYAVALANDTDYSPLKDLPLEKCGIGAPFVTDLSFLAVCPLKEIGLFSCENLRGLSWLNKIKSLERLILPWNYRTLPEADLQAIEALRDHPRLAFLQEARGASEIETWRLFRVTQSKETFWRDWDREQAFLPAIRAAGFTFSLNKLPDDTYRLAVERQPLSDLSFLKGAPISDLSIGGTAVTDLTPVAKLPLRVLWIWGTPVTDLTPLRGSAIEQLSLEGSKVRDLSPVEGLPLTKLYAHSCRNLSDVSVLARVPTLQRLTVSITARGIEKLRDLPNLKWLAFAPDPANADILRTTAETFWKRWPGMAWSKALNESGMKYNASEPADGIWSVAVTSPEFSDCSIFKGAPIRQLTLNGTRVADLRPLAEIPLTHLKIGNTQVRDLSPLRDPVLSASLLELSLHGTRVTDFAAVAACRNLVLFSASFTELADLEILRGRQLRSLHIRSTQVTDLSALAGMPLLNVYLAGTRVTDLRPLLQCPTLEKITLPEGARDVPSLRALSSLRNISYRSESNNEPKQAAPDFWREYETSAWISTLRDAGIAFKNLSRLDDGTWDVRLAKTALTDFSALSGARISSLDLGGTGIADLTPLRGMPLKSLGLSNTSVADLSPLRRLPLKKLMLFDTKVTDLSPLKEMLLEELNLRGAPVSDLSPLRGMPLRALRLQDSAVTDISPIADCQTLRTLVLPAKAMDIEFLRSFPNLERLSYDAQVDGLPRQTAEEFWREYDALAWLRASGLSYARARMLPDGGLDLDFRGSKVSDLSPLAGMPLVSVDIAGTNVTDISALREMPLVKLRMHNCKGLADLSPLAGLKSLETVTLPPNAKDISFLRNAGAFPKLKRLSFVENPVTRQPDKTAAEFWKEYDTKKKP